MVRKASASSLFTDDAEALEYLKSFKIGDDFEVEVRFKRNGAHHRKGMAILRYIYDNQSKYDVFEIFLTEVKILTGHVDTHIRSDGTIFFVPKSISFMAMGEPEFQVWKNTALRCVFDNFIPQMSEKDQDRVVNHLLANS